MAKNKQTNLTSSDGKKIFEATLLDKEEKEL